MNVLELYRDDYKFECDNITRDCSKYSWAASEVFELTTYDRDLDEMFVKKIIEVCKVILENRAFDYIRDESNYVDYILVCQLLEHFHWIEWGTSIRGAWFEESHQKYYESQPIVKCPYTHAEGPIPFTVDNLKALIEFMEE